MLLSRYLIPLALVVGAASPVHAQVVERHLPTAPETAARSLIEPNALPTEQDATPIGPALRAIVLLGPSEAAHVQAGDGLTVGEISRLRADEAAVASRLRPFLGQPLSRKLIAQIQASLAGRYRELRHPFVSFSTPEQEIGGGALQIRVIEFVAGDIRLSGAASDAEAARLRDGIGLRSGAPIDAVVLGRELDGLNRYPFRRVQAVFSPSAALGVSDLTLAVQHERPWQVYGGYSNDGSPSTSPDRYFVGGAVGGLLGRDSVLSAQATGSRDALGGERDPRYQGLALTYVSPVGQFGQVEASVDGVETHQALEPFAVRQRALQGAVGYRWPVGDWLGGQASSSLKVGVELKRQVATTYFSGVSVYGVAMNVYQAYIGYSRQDQDGLGASSLDLAVRLSPGGLDGASSDARAVLYSQGRLKRADYGYVSLDYSRLTKLPRDFSLRTRLSGQFTSAALPRTEQAGLGGTTLVRGYTLDNGAFDTAVILRNELHLPQRTFDPYAFVDVGHGRDNALSTGSDLASAGLGARLQLARHLVIQFDAGRALTDDQAVRSGDWRAHTNITVAF